MIFRPWRAYTEHTFGAFHAQIVSFMPHFFASNIRGVDPSIKPLVSRRYPFDTVYMIGHRVELLVF